MSGQDGNLPADDGKPKEGEIEMTEERRELLEWKVKHSREVADRAKARGDMETYKKLTWYISQLEKELLQ